MSTISLPNRDYVPNDHDRRIIALGMVDSEGNLIDERWIRIARMSSLQMVAEGIVTVERVDR